MSGVVLFSFRVGLVTAAPPKVPLEQFPASLQVLPFKVPT
jgi:hypothetical protein